MSIDIKLSKTRISKIFQSGVFLGLLLSKIPLMKVRSHWQKKLVLLGITTATSAIDAITPKKMHGSGATTLIISNEEMNDVMEIVRALEYSKILKKVITKTIENEKREQKGGLLGVLIGYDYGFNVDF